MFTFHFSVYQPYFDAGLTSTTPTPQNENPYRQKKKSWFHKVLNWQRLSKQYPKGEKFSRAFCQLSITYFHYPCLTAVICPLWGLWEEFCFLLPFLVCLWKRNFAVKMHMVIPMHLKCKTAHNTVQQKNKQSIQKTDMVLKYEHIHKIHMCLITEWLVNTHWTFSSPWVLSLLAVPCGYSLLFFLQRSLPTDF